MRIWLDPAKLNSFQLTPVDVKNAIATQNVKISSGELGGLPSVEGQQLYATVKGPTRRNTNEDLRQIIVRAYPTGSKVGRQCVGSVTMGGERGGRMAEVRGEPGA